MKNMEVWNSIKQPPPEALKKITGGRLAGKTDINPQWRYQVMTEQFGMCGGGWKYEVAVWNEPSADGQVFAFAKVNLCTKQGSEWSDPIPGVGGSMLVAKESGGLHASDEGYKMAITDALSVAMKMLGMGANVYAGLSDGKYAPKPKAKEEVKTSEEPTVESEKEFKNIGKLLTECSKFKITRQQVLDLIGVADPKEITDFNEAWMMIRKELIRAEEAH